MIGSLEVTHELIFTIPSAIQNSSISSISSIQLRFNVGKRRSGFHFCVNSQGKYHL